MMRSRISSLVNTKKVIMLVNSGPIIGRLAWLETVRGATQWSWHVLI